VPAANRVGDEGQGWTCAKFLLTNERVLVSEVGRSARELARLRALASRTLRRGRALLADPLFARRIDELALRLWTLRATCYRAIADGIEGQDIAAASSQMKLRGSELRQDIAEAMLDVIGRAGLIFDPASVAGGGLAPPIGPPESPGIVRDHLHGRATTIYGGSNEIQRQIIAKAALGI
jgi:alkylation response protein AidB-like acyl-CoA dehydrogenase